MSTVFDDLSVYLKELDWFKDQIIFQDGLPDKPDEAAAICGYGGLSTDRHHGYKGVAVTAHGIEIKIRSNTPSVALARCKTVTEHMDGTVNMPINGTLFQSIFMSNAARQIFKDPGGQVTYSIAFNVKREGV